MQENIYTNMRVRKDTQRKLKIVAALSQESMLDSLERLVSREFDRLHKKGGDDAAQQEDQTRSE